MRISEKNKSKLYSSIRENIMTLRIEIPMSNTLTNRELDERLCKLEIDMWKDIKKTLNIKDK